MFDALYIGATGLRGQQMQIDAIAQNVANLQSIGYRRSVISFAEMVATAGSSGVDSSRFGSASLAGAGAIPTITVSNRPGELKQTGEAMHVAIDGQGFFEVIRLDGAPAYTRSGVLTVNNERMLSTLDGGVLAARISVPPDASNLRIAADGTITCMVGGRDTPVELGRIELTTFANPASMKAVGGGLYAASAESGEAQSGTPGEQGLGIVRQGFLESSNVQMTDELVNLMLAQRAFELNSKLVQAADQMLSITNGLMR